MNLLYPKPPFPRYFLGISAPGVVLTTRGLSPFFHHIFDYRMKKHQKFLLTAIVLSALWLPQLSAQQSVAAAGGDASGAGGSVAYSVGQVVYTAYAQGGAQIVQGVQQPYELFTVGTEGPSDLALHYTVFPNPTAATVTLSVADVDWTALSFALFDEQGRLILQQKLEGESTRIPLEGQNAGLYFLKIQDKLQTLKTFKIVKNH